MELPPVVRVCRCKSGACLTTPPLRTNRPQVLQNEVLPALAGLPQLQHLHITPSWAYDSVVSSDLQGQRRQIQEAMLKDVQTIEVTALDTFKFTVQVVDTHLAVTHKAGGGNRNYMFAVVSPPPASRMDSGSSIYAL